MGVCGNLFHASVRSATTSNFRGKPSAGTEFSEVMRTKFVLLVLLRRSGSNTTEMAAPIGARIATVPKIIVAVCLKNPRRPVEPAQSQCECASGLSFGALGLIQRSKGYARFFGRAMTPFNHRRE